MKTQNKINHFSYFSRTYTTPYNQGETLPPPFGMDEATWAIYWNALERRYAPQNTLTLNHISEIILGGLK